MSCLYKTKQISNFNRVPRSYVLFLHKNDLFKVVKAFNQKPKFHGVTLTGEIFHPSQNYELIRHFDTVEGTTLKYMASRSPSMA
jgi:hypothetical protein